MSDSAPTEDVPPTDAGRPRRRIRLVIAGSLALVLFLVAGTSAWIWVVRPRQLVEVHDDTGRISVRVPRAWTKEVEGRVPQQFSAYLVLGEFEEAHLRVAVFNGPGSFDPGEQCGAAAENLADNAPTAQIRLWAYRDCPKGQVTIWMQKTFERRGTAIVRVRADDERTARQVLDSIKVD
jgi:hypothetical protein